MKGLCVRACNDVLILEITAINYSAERCTATIIDLVTDNELDVF